MAVKNGIKNFLKIVREGSFLDVVLFICWNVCWKIQHYQRFMDWGRTLVVDNRHGNDSLLIIVAGYNEFLWEKVFWRVVKYMERWVDVCVVHPGGKINVVLKEYCEKNGWTYLHIKENRLALAQNIAIEMHPNAQFIYKIDEDIFITEWFFSKLRKKYELAVKNSEFYPWAISPVVNINPWTYKFFLKCVWKIEDYSELFWSIQKNITDAGGDICKIWIYKSWDVAKYIRKLTLDLDSCNRDNFSILQIDQNYIPIVVYYTIWCFMFPRSIRERMWWFEVAQRWALWCEEQVQKCASWSNPIILCENCLCGHFWFKLQKKEMFWFFEKNKKLF